MELKKKENFTLFCSNIEADSKIKYSLENSLLNKNYKLAAMAKNINEQKSSNSIKANQNISYEFFDEFSEKSDESEECKNDPNLLLDVNFNLFSESDQEEKHLETKVDIQSHMQSVYEKYNISNNKRVNDYITFKTEENLKRNVTFEGHNLEGEDDNQPQTKSVITLK